MIKNILKILGAFMRKRGHLVLIFALLLFYPDMVSAVGETAKGAVEDTLVTTVNLFIKVLNMILWPLLLIIGDLMSNDLIIGPGMEERLLSIWQQIRNLVNIAFVLVLLIMAFYNVSGFAKDGNFALKTGLPKLIIGLILVNFTFLGGKLVLDLSNMATSAVFSLPELAAGGEGAFDFNENITTLEENLCIKGEKEDGTFFDKAVDGKNIPALTQMFCEQTDGKYSGKLSAAQKTRFFQSLNTNNIGLIIAVNMGHLEDLKYADGAVTSISDLAINLLFSLAMFVVFAVSYIVLALVLVARIAILWIAMAFSPVIVLFYVVPELKAGAGKAGNLSEQVLTNILAPIKIGIVLTVGFMMLDAMYGTVGSSFNSAIGKSSLSTISDGALLITGIADLQRLLIAITSIVVLWKAIFFAVDGTIAAGMIEKVKGAVESTGSTALSYLKYTPLAPISVKNAKGADETMGLSLGNLGRMASDFRSDFENAQTKKAKDIYEGIGLDKLFPGGGDPLERLAEMVKNNPGRTEASDYRKGLLEGAGLKDVGKDYKIREQMGTIINGMIEKYVSADRQAEFKGLYRNNKENPQGLQELIRKISKEKNAPTFSTEEYDQLLTGAPLAPTPPAPAPAPPPAAPTIPAGSKAMNTLAAPTGLTVTIPATLHVPTAVTGFTNLATPADATALNTKLAAPGAQAKIDAYMSANKSATTIDVKTL